MSLKQARYQPEGRGPLVGVRVLDLSRLVAGNMLHAGARPISAPR